VIVLCHLCGEGADPELLPLDSFMSIGLGQHM